MSIWSRAFWAAAGERALRTAAQAAVGAIGADVLVGVTGINWAFVGSVAALGAILSVLMSVGTGAIQGSGPGLTEVPTPIVVQPQRPVGANGDPDQRAYGNGGKIPPL